MGQFFSNDCQEVVAGLYIGHVDSATDAGCLARNGITHVVDVSGRFYAPPPGITLLRLPVPDVPEFDIRQIFGRTNSFIADAIRSGNRVLVHCAWGKSRSAAVILAYLMAYHRMSLDDSLALLKSKRSVVQPNSGFMKFLKMYELELDTYRKTNSQL